MNRHAFPLRALCGAALGAALLAGCATTEEEAVIDLSGRTYERASRDFKACNAVADETAPALKSQHQPGSGDALGMLVSAAPSPAPEPARAPNPAMDAVDREDRLLRCMEDRKYEIEYPEKPEKKV